MLLSSSCCSRAVACKQAPVKGVATPPSTSSSRLAVRMRAEPQFDRDTGFVSEDNSGRANIFPRKQQAYISSSRADAAAQQGLGGAQGGILLAVVIAAVVAATVLEFKAPGPETLQSVQVGDTFSGESLSAIAQRIQSSI